MKKISFKSIKSFTIGLIIGASLLSTGNVFANALTLEKIQAYLNYDISIKYNDKNVALSNPPITYNGKTYLPLTDVGKLTNTSVKWNQQERSVEMTTQELNELPLDHRAESTYSKYGFKTVYLLNEKEYIPVKDIVLNNFGFNPNISIGKLALISIKNGDEVIPNVEYMSIMGAWSIEYNYYLNTILPLDK
jgi:hypothetical protein